MRIATSRVLCHASKLDTGIRSERCRDWSNFLDDREDSFKDDQEVQEERLHLQLEDLRIMPIEDLNEDLYKIFTRISNSRRQFLISCAICSHIEGFDQRVKVTCPSRAS
ncbi:hypothetical protein PC128_g11247 [Phytophthora cactorum]|nr:hypothetical protein PC120_g10629 [Phytophthora cactorum]KAG3190551.1 hypothetical protein PC128_g11247 [Phytophthora cactorum]KAG4045386.1 hypothetical protein PC123_g19200 [Phytophthora cactorum]